MSERQPRHMLLSLDAGCVCEMCEMRRENQRLRDALAEANEYADRYFEDMFPDREG